MIQVYDFYFYEKIDGSSLKAIVMVFMYIFPLDTKVKEKNSKLYQQNDKTCFVRQLST